MPQLYPSASETNEVPVHDESNADDLRSALERHPGVSVEEFARIRRARDFIADQLDYLAEEYPATSTMSRSELTVWLRDFNSPI
jgi:hypothetical protein